MDNKLEHYRHWIQAILTRHGSDFCYFEQMFACLSVAIIIANCPHRKAMVRSVEPIGDVLKGRASLRLPPGKANFWVR